MTKILLKSLALIVITAFAGCKINKKQDSATKNKLMQVVFDDITITPGKHNYNNYQPAPTRLADILHTKLDVKFNWTEQLVYGKAVLTIKPYMFKHLNQVTLNANMFLLNQVALLKNADTINLKYTYDNKLLTINLNKTYNHTDTFNLYINYTAQPNKINDEVGSAITDSKGLYFINPLAKDPNKPQQIWTQGESKYNNGWFPTIDEPNEKHTQEIAITVDPKFTTLSNGELVYSNYNYDGTRTDYWQQLKPHSPYLTMLAIGEFAVVKDKWRNTMEVNYYVEPKYKPYAKTIFGVTPEMIEVYSNVLGVNYPWDKFSQVVVRDFVSGAMENTSAVVHYEAVAHTNREHLDNPHEDIIAHELFHHWFGDLVTCVSWSNLPLNESFATYGEYIWNEYKHGKPFADLTFSRNLDSYLRSKNKHGLVPIRTHYGHQDEMFDVISYQKGSRILHMLRGQIGDKAFFKGLQIYLTNNKFANADIHNLRLAMQEASGEDLNLFFNQWFLKSGHPNLQVNYRYANNSLTVITKQLQDSIFGLYNLPSNIGYAFKNTEGVLNYVVEPITIENKIDTFSFSLLFEPSYVTIDNEGVLLVQLNEQKSDAYWLNQLLLSKNYAVKQRAARQTNIWTDFAKIELLKSAIDYCINDSVALLNNLGFGLMFANKNLIKSYYSFLISASKNHQSARTRMLALKTLDATKDSNLISVYINALNDSSYQVLTTALELIYNYNPTLGLSYCSQLENDENSLVQNILADIYTDETVKNKQIFYANNLGKQGMYNFQFFNSYINYLKSKNLTEINEGINTLEKYYNTNSDAYTPKLIKTALNTLEKSVTDLKPSEEQKALLVKIKQFKEQVADSK